MKDWNFGKKGAMTDKRRENLWELLKIEMQDRERRRMRHLAGYNAHG